MSGYRFGNMRAVAPAGLVPVAWELVSQGFEFGGSVYTAIVPDACLRSLDPAGVLRLRANISMATGAETRPVAFSLVVSVASQETEP